MTAPMTPSEHDASQREAAYRSWFDEQVRLGIEDADAGNLHSDEAVRKHFEARVKKLDARHRQAA